MLTQTKYLLSDCDLGEEEAQAVADVVRSKWLSVGPRTAEFEAAFAAFLADPAENPGAEIHAVSVSNCTAALHLALLAVGVGPGDEVLVPSYTFVASANAVLYCGATPVFVDIAGPHDLNLDVADLEAKITPKTRAVVAVHMCGFPVDLDRIMALSEAHGFKVVEDACHAIGARYAGDRSGPTASAFRGRAAGTIGHAGCFSFFANKNLVTGEGGMVVTRDPDIARYARLGRSHGMTKTSWDKAKGRATGYDVVQPGFNYRGTELTAALGLVQLRKLPAANARRRDLVARYRERLADAGLPLSVPFAGRLDDSAHHVFAVLVDATERVAPFREALDGRGVQTTHHYPPVHTFSHFRRAAAGGGDVGVDALPRTIDASAREVTLPLHPLLADDDVDQIVSRVSDCLASTVSG